MTETTPKPRRGELWMTRLGPPTGHEQGFDRPALVVSSDRWNELALTSIVVPLTRNNRGRPTRVEIEPGTRNGLRATSYARCEDVRSVSNVRLARRLGVVSLRELAAVERSLRLLLDR